MKVSRMHLRVFTSAVAITFAFSTLAIAEATLDDVERSFYPYKDGPPKVEGIEPGLVISKDSWQVAEQVLDPVTLQFVKDGWTSIRVTETKSFDLHPNYVEATRKTIGTVKLAPQPGLVEGYVAGRPFPEEPSADDPRAGEKLAWNYQYGYNWGDNAAIRPFYWKYRNLNTGNIERTLKFNFHYSNFMHRVNQAPVPEITPNPDRVWRGIYVHALEPFDVANTQVLIHKYKDDRKRSDSWLYLGFQRRVRRLASGQITDSFLGSDLMIEDFEGYNGRISDVDWTYKGTKTMLLPFYDHNSEELTTEHKESDGYQFIDYEGKGGCFPKHGWQLRKTYVLEIAPKDSNHPIGKRVMYVDAQTFTLPLSLVYDRKGNLWKWFLIGQAHPDTHHPVNKGTGVSIDDSFSVIDVTADHCTTGQFRGLVDPALTKRSLFTVQHMRTAAQ